MGGNPFPPGTKGWGGNAPWFSGPIGGAPFRFFSPAGFFQVWGGEKESIFGPGRHGPGRGKFALPGCARNSICKPDADTEERLVLRRIQHGGAQAARVHLAHAIPHRPLPWEHHTSGGGDHLRIVRHGNLAPGRDLAQGLFDRAQIAHPIVYDCDIDHRNYRVPLVDGITPAMRGSSSSAMRNARPNALNMVSAWWWALLPARCRWQRHQRG